MNFNVADIEVGKLSGVKIPATGMLVHAAGYDVPLICHDIYCENSTWVLLQAFKDGEIFAPPDFDSSHSETKFCWSGYIAIGWNNVRVMHQSRHL